MTLQLYGIPHCGTCKKAIAWLKANDIPHEFINTKECPPQQAQIQQWVTERLAVGARVLAQTACKLISAPKFRDRIDPLSLP